MPRLVFGISHWKVHNIEKPKTIQGKKTIQITVWDPEIPDLEISYGDLIGILI